MKNNLRVNVNSKWKIDVSEKDIQSLDLVNSSDNFYNLLYKDKSYNLEVVNSDFGNKKYAVKVNGTVYTVSIEDQLDQLISEMGFSKGTTKNVKLIKAPMPGMVLNVNVKVGETVSENDTLLILEAMKMESSLLSPGNGIVKKISIKNGETVEKGQLLIEFE